MISQILQLLHPLVCKLIYALKWKCFRPVQERMIRAFFGSQADLLAAAPTSGGKTEAAALPILSDILQNPVLGFSVLWVSPLKSLINDTHLRLQPMGATLDIPVSAWHGDIPANVKKKLRRHPEGVLLITPESLEANLVLHRDWVRRAFQNVRCVVVDEVHSMIDVPRGQHLQSLLCRLFELIGRRPRLIGLSATLGDFISARRFLNPAFPESVEVIDCQQDSRKISVSVVGRLKPTPSARQRGEFVSLTPAEALALAESLGPSLMTRATLDGLTLPTVEKADLVGPYGHILLDILHVATLGSNLVFFNQRALLEWFADQLKHLAKEHGLPETSFLHHHSSISKELRERAERLLKVARYITVLATSSLELGIDMQSVLYVLQIMAPFMVTSLKQRVGRSGRKEGQTRRLRLYTLDASPNESPEITNLLYPELLRGIAVVELTLKGELEPSPLQPKLHLSTALHQMLALLKQEGPLSDEDLFRRLCVAFRRLDKETFTALLENTLKQDLTTRTSEGQYVLGQKGELLAGSHEFFAVFSADVEFDVLDGDTFIGKLPVTPNQQEGSEVILDGRRWIIERINRKARRIHVVASDRANEPTFLGRGGDIHDIIVREMRALLAGPTIPAYLDPPTVDLLQAARTTAAKAGLLERSVLVCERGIYWYPWLGTKGMLTLSLAAYAKELKHRSDRLALYYPGLSIENLIAHLRSIAAGQLDGRTLAAHLPDKKSERYDGYLSEDLLITSAAADRLDLPSAERAAAAALAELAMQQPDTYRR